MRTFGVLVGVGLFALVVGCGSNSTSSGGGGQGGATGLGGSGGSATGTGGSGGGTACTLPSCMSGFANCMPSGTCVQQLNLSTYLTNYCYSNGVKMIWSLDATTRAPMLTFKQNSSVCFSIVSPTGTDTAFAVKDASGQAIGTVTVDNSGNTTVTCNGGTPVAIPAGCNFVDAFTGGGSTSSCTDGACS